MSDTAKLAIWHSLNCEAIYDDSGVSCTCDYDKAQEFAVQFGNLRSVLDDIVTSKQNDSDAQVAILREEYATLQRLAKDVVRNEYGEWGDLERSVRILARHLEEKP